VNIKIDWEWDFKKLSAVDNLRIGHSQVTTDRRFLEMAIDKIFISPRKIPFVGATFENARHLR